MTTCAHSEERRFAWTVPDPIKGGHILCMGCCDCGQVLSGAVDEQGNDVGPQHRLGSERTKSKSKAKKGVLA